ncbi:MAG: DUF4126 domain-containing protein [Verrucomicrobiales bacterium]
MEPLQTLCLALGLSTLAGLRLYLTVFLTSLSLHQGWLTLDPSYASLEVLGSDGVLIASGILLVLEFLADKIAGFDSVWDSIHTAIRPIGATILTLQVLGDWPPEAKVIAGLCAGTVALTVHAAKAGTRLLVNTSPEPVSNALVSTAEDIMVAGLFALLVQHPLLAGAVFVGLIAFCLWATPRAYRMAKATFWLLWQKLTTFARPGRVELPRHLAPDHDMAVTDALGKSDLTVAWAVETLSSRTRGHRGLDGNRFGVLVASHERPDTLVFLARKLFRQVPVKISLVGCQVSKQSTFLSENLAIYHRQTRQRAIFRFPRSEAEIVARLVEDVQARTGPPAPAIAPERVAML